MNSLALAYELYYYIFIDILLYYFVPIFKKKNIRDKRCINDEYIIIIYVSKFLLSTFTFNLYLFVHYSSCDKRTLCRQFKMYPKKI